MRADTTKYCGLTEPISTGVFQSDLDVRVCILGDLGSSLIPVDLGPAEYTPVLPSFFNSEGKLILDKLIHSFGDAKRRGSSIVVLTSYDLAKKGMQIALRLFSSATACCGRLHVQACGRIGAPPDAPGERDCA